MFSQEWRRFVSEAEFGSASSWAERKKRCRGKTEERKKRPDENPTILLGVGGGEGSGAKCGERCALGLLLSILDTNSLEFDEKKRRNFREFFETSPRSRLGHLGKKQ